MKQKIFTLLLIAAAGFTACRKSQEADPNIKQYDDQQIQAYINANGLTDFKRDTVGGDTTGMYYKIINKGTGTPLEYSDLVSLVFTLKSFDGKYNSTDTISNHMYNFLGRIGPGPDGYSGLPIGLQTAIKTILKYRDGSMRLLIPSRLAYGVAGTGTGSVTNLNSRIAGNQSLEYYVHVINDQQVYDDLVIRNYMTANNLTGYTKTASGVYYKNVQAGDGVALIGDASTYGTNYTLKLLNNVAIVPSAPESYTNGVVSLEPPSKGVKEVLLGKSVGSAVSMLIPSRLAYGAASPTSSGIPSNACLYYDYIVTSVTN